MHEEKLCKHCGNPFEKTGKNQDYCSKECRDKAHRIRRKNRQSGKLVLKSCLWCKKLFKEDKHKHIYCSKKCRTMARRARERKKYHDKYQHKCWTCTNYAVGCPWSENKVPVPGWIAEPVERKNKGKESGIGYKVISCPKYSSDGTNNL